MMGSRGPKGGLEQDALTRAKRYYKFSTGLRRWVKRKFWKRQRHQAKLDTRYYYEQGQEG